MVEALNGWSGKDDRRSGGDALAYVSFRVDQRTSTAGEAILLQYGDFEARFCESRRCGYAANSGALVVEKMLVARTCCLIDRILLLAYDDRRLLPFLPSHLDEMVFVGRMILHMFARNTEIP